MYKKYRNHIIELAKDQYLPPSNARKGLAGDASAIIRIHHFLEKWGIINYIHTKTPAKCSISPPTNPENQPNNLLKKDAMDKDKQIANKFYGKDDLELLKKITRRFRPSCSFCENITGAVWFEFTT